MARRRAFAVAAVGARTAVGRSAGSSAAAVRAGISGFTEHVSWVDTEGEPIRVAAAPWLDPQTPVAVRIGMLFRDALEEAAAPLAGDRALRVHVVVALPEYRPGLPRDASGEIARVLDRRGIRPQRIRWLERGHAGGYLGLLEAGELLSDDEADAVLLVAADSYMSAETLEWLESTDQLQGAGPLNNAWGFVPGEAAGALLLVDPARTPVPGLPILAEIAGVGATTERALIKSDAVCLGEGLSDALREAFALLSPGVRIDDVYCDLNGEPYRADEFGFATVRNAECFVDGSRFVTPADCWGDVGAATQPLLTLLATAAHSKRYAHGPTTLVCGGSEGGARGAAILRFAGAG